MKKEIHLLIIGEAFLPPAYLPRIRYFCNYFTQKGWKIDMIAESADNQKFIPQDIHVQLIPYYRQSTGIKAKIEWLIKFGINLVYDHKGYYFYKYSKRLLKEKKYDAVFCSSSFTFPLTTANLVAKKLNIPLIVDLRDIAEQSPEDHHYLANTPPKIIEKIIVPLYKVVQLRRRNRVLKVAQAVTTVSPWHVKTLSKYNSSTNLIYNGFDENIFSPTIVQSEKFIISYFGRVFNREMRNPDLLFEAVRNLVNSSQISEDKIILNWYVDKDSQKVISKIALEYNLTQIAHFHDFVDPEMMIKEMHNSSILLTLSNIQTKKRYFGIMTTKFFESIGVNKPILCIPDNKDDLSELIQKTGCGLISSDIIEIENFILNQFKEWKLTGKVTGPLSENDRLKFSRRKGAEILEKIITNSINNESY